MRTQLRIRDEHVNFPVPQDVTHLVRLEEIIDRHDHCTRVQDAKEHWHEFRTILQPQRHAVARLHAELLRKPSPHRLRLCEQRGKGKLILAPEHGDFLGALFYRFGERNGQIHW